MIYEFFTSRNNGANAASFVGQAGRLFYDGANGVIKLSDGTTPGGTFIPYNIATTSTIGGIKAGPGANVSVDGTLTIDTSGLPLGIGNLSFVDTTISTINANADLILASNGTGNVELLGNIHFHTTASGGVGRPFFDASSDGQITILVPAADPLAGAVKIIGSQTGAVSPPLNTGVMLQLTGNNNDPSRLYNDSIGSFAAFVGRRINGNVSHPTAVQAGDELIRISSTGHDGNSVPGAGSARILYTAKENYTVSAKGTNLSIWTTAIGSTTLTKTATFDRETGLAVSGNISAARIVTTGVRSIQDGIWANLNFATDNIVHLYQPSGEVTVNLSNYTAGATIRLLINMATARTVNLGVTAASSTNGSTQLTAAKLTSNQAVQIVYICIDGTSANCHAILNYA